jgi:hypothetical protein
MKPERIRAGLYEVGTFRIERRAVSSAGRRGGRRGGRRSSTTVQRWVITNPARPEPGLHRLHFVTLGEAVEWLEQNRR